MVMSRMTRADYIQYKNKGKIHFQDFIILGWP